MSAFSDPISLGCSCLHFLQRQAVAGFAGLVFLLLFFFWSFVPCFPSCADPVQAKWESGGEETVMREEGRGPGQPLSP